MAESSGINSEAPPADELVATNDVMDEGIVSDKGLSPWAALRLSLRRSRVRDEYIIGGILLFAAGISHSIFFLKDTILDVTNLSSLGYLGVFVFTLLGAATIFLPSGGGAAVILAGAVLNPVAVGFLAGIGSALGELTGYAIGYQGGAVLEKRANLYIKAKRWMERRGSITIFLLSVLPNPLFDAAGLAAGGIGYPLRKFLALAWMGKTIQALGGAFVGALGSDWLIALAETVLD
ncbi:MAG: DedA family protein [Dehalococcoidia bacterium]